MRELKFRAWDKERCRMSFPFKVTGFAVFFVKDSVPLQFLSDTNRFEIMQYTESKDKNGKEIYEGDIVQIKDRFVMWSKSKGQITEDVNAVVEWSSGGFTPRRLGNTRSWILDMEQYEVIGNIYENPELLEEVNDGGDT
jgi:uncharacterized phage protein (TIGR01671 family)